MSTNVPEICTNTAYLNSVNQKNKFRLFNIPANRYDNLARNPYLQINPDTGKPFTKFELDMRRKSEILKYSSNRMGTQTNNLTRAQKYAQAISGYYQQRTFSKTYIAENTVNGIVNICPTGTIIKTPSSASDVPGNMLLYEDTKVPLYNFVNNSAYGIINQLDNPYSTGFQSTNENNVIYNGQQPAPILTLYMFNTPTPNYSFSFTTPILLQFFGSLNSTTLSPSGTNNVFQISFNSITTNINYSFSSMPVKSGITYSIKNEENVVTPISDQTILDIGVNSTATNFNGSYYLGAITVSDIKLPVALGYIYDFQLSINFSILYPESSKYPTYYSQPTVKSVFNVTNSILPGATNCSITPRTDVIVGPGTPYASLSVSGTGYIP